MDLDQARALLEASPDHRVSRVDRSEPMTMEARIASLRTKADLHDFDYMTYPSGVAADKIKAETPVKPSREGLISALSGGVFTHGDNKSGVVPFVRDRILPIVRDGQWFDFGRIDFDTIMESGDDWTQFASAGLIQLPYPKTVFRAATKANLFWVAEQQDRDSPLSLLSLVTNTGFVSADGARGTLSLSSHSFAAYTRASLQAHALLHKSITHDLFLVLWLILNTRGVATTTVTPPEKLQRARAKVGKQPLKPFFRVDTATYVTALTETVRMAAEGVGTHASPRPHLRRAHLRHVANGAIVPVMATIVNGSAEVRMAMREKYTVQKGLPR